MRVIQKKIGKHVACLLIATVMLLSGCSEKEADDSETSSIPKQAVSSSEKEESKEYTLEEKYELLEEHYKIEIPRKEIDFPDLQANVNENIYAWVYVPGTQVDYPVLQHPTEDDHYLFTNLDESHGYPGCVYSEGSVNHKDFEDRVTVLYAHNMPNKTMFGSLEDYESREYFDQNRYIFVYLPNDIKVYEIVSSYWNDNTHLLKSMDWDDESFMRFLDLSLMVEGNQNHCLETYDFDTDDKLLILSTCVLRNPLYRRLVIGEELDEAY